MTRISADVIRVAAYYADDLMESSSAEVKLLLGNPQFATGLCLVLHKELSALRKRVAELESVTGRIPVQEEAVETPEDGLFHASGRAERRTV